MRLLGRPEEAVGPGADEPEELLAVLRPHWWALAGPAALVVGALAATAALLAADVPEAALLAAGAVLVAAAARLLVRYARWGSTRFVVTSDRLVLRRGVLARHIEEVPLRAVTGVGVRQSVRQRLLRAGDLEVAVAGDPSALVVPDVAAARRVAGEVGRLAPRPPRPAPLAGADATAVQPRA